MAPELLAQARLPRWSLPAAWPMQCSAAGAGRPALARWAHRRDHAAHGHPHRWLEPARRTRAARPRRGTHAHRQGLHAATPGRPEAGPARRHRDHDRRPRDLDRGRRPRARLALPAMGLRGRRGDAAHALRLVGTAGHAARVERAARARRGMGRAHRARTREPDRAAPVQRARRRPRAGEDRRGQRPRRMPRRIRAFDELERAVAAPPVSRPPKSSASTWTFTATKS